MIVLYRENPYIEIQEVSKNSLYRMVIEKYLDKFLI